MFGTIDEQKIFLRQFNISEDRFRESMLTWDDCTSWYLKLIYMEKKMKKCKKILLVIFIVVLLLFLGMSYFIGTQVFMGSTQLVTCEDTSKVKDSFW